MPTLLIFSKSAVLQSLPKIGMNSERLRMKLLK